MSIYQRSLQELESHACKWWPEYLSEITNDNSILPVLLDSQDRFLSILR